MRRSHLISTTSSIVFLARSGYLNAAQKLFDEMPDRDTIAWNAMLAACSNSGHPSRTLSLFHSMRASNVPTDPFSFTSAFAAAAGLRCLRAGEKLHCLSLRLGLRSFLPVSNALIDMYGKCFSPFDALRLFEETNERNEVSWCSLLHAFVMSGFLCHAYKLFYDMPIRNVVSWNILITGIASSDYPEMSIALFREMLVLCFKADALTFTALINACTKLSESFFGQLIHALIIQNGWISTVEVCNSLLSFYAKFNYHFDAFEIFESMQTRSQVSWNIMMDAQMKFGNVEEALKLFLAAPDNNIVSWTAIITGFARNGHEELALQYFVNMQKNYHLLDEFTLGVVLHACADLTVLGNGLMVHGCIFRHGLESFAYVSNGLVNMYAKCGDILSSGKVFDEMEGKDLVSWNAMIFGLAAHGLAHKALRLFEEMICSCIFPDRLTFLGLLMACCHSGLVEQGLGVLSDMGLIHGISPEADHVTCVVDMISRAGFLKQADKIGYVFSGVAGERHEGYCEALLNGSSIYGDLSLGKKEGERLMGVEPGRDVGYVMLSNLYCFRGRWNDGEKVRRAMKEYGVKKTPGCSWVEVRGMLKVFTSGISSIPHMIDLHNMLTILESEMRCSCFINSEL